MGPQSPTATDARHFDDTASRCGVAMPETRLHFIVARKAPVAVVFRRGPSRQVELLKWDLTTDELVAGQWLKGRIYERRCDLSPTGEYLIYFAAKYETELRTWTAVSRPPFLTALALWPKGDAWGGGGLFDSDRRIRLNHRPDEMNLLDGFRLAPSMRIEPLGDRPGWGEDDPIHDFRLVRDGWRLVENGAQEHEHDYGKASPWVTFDPPIQYRREVGPRKRPITLETSIKGLKERDGPWYIQTYRLLDGDESIREIGRADWMDAAPDGGLRLARDGRLLRLDVDTVVDWATAEFREVADLRDHRFEPRTAPREALNW